jgi:hypothetical protein
MRGRGVLRQRNGGDEYIKDMKQMKFKYSGVAASLSVRRK